MLWKKGFALAVVMTLVITLFVGCAPEAQEPEDNGDQEPAVEKIVMITDTGGIDDKSFNQSAWEGLQSMQGDYPDVNFDFILSTNEDEYVANLRTAVEGGSDLTWAIGYMLADAMTEIAADMPEQKFGIVDVDWLAHDNLVQVVFDEHEGSFLVGVVAGMVTESNKLGFVGGMSGDLIKKFETGFRAGVKAVNPDAEVSAEYAESWGDPAIGNEIASAMYDQGADVIYHAAGHTGVGVFEAAKTRGTGPEGFWTIGVDRDQIDEAPDNMLTSMIKKVGSAMVQVNEDLLANDEFAGGEVLSFGLVEDGVGIAPTTEETLPEDLKDEVLAKVEEFKQKIIDGEITVPKNDEEFENWSIDQ